MAHVKLRGYLKDPRSGKFTWQQNLSWLG